VVDVPCCYVCVCLSLEVPTPRSIRLGRKYNRVQGAYLSFICKKIGPNALLDQKLGLFDQIDTIVGQIYHLRVVKTVGFVLASHTIPPIKYYLLI
jgi:hypothetical protein